MPRKQTPPSLELPPDYKAPPRPVRSLNPMRLKLRRFLDVRWSSNAIPIKTSEIQSVLGLSGKEWIEKRREVERWLSVAGWRKCSRKLGRTQPSRSGYWPPLRPASKIDDWSEYDD